MEKVCKLMGNIKIDAALSLHAEKFKFNEVTNFLQSLVWDGIPGLDTLLVDYLGAKDSKYVRVVTRKAFVTANQSFSTR